MFGKTIGLSIWFLVVLTSFSFGQDLGGGKTLVSTGWSEDGKLALVTNDEVSPGSGWSYHYLIADMVNDEVLFSENQMVVDRNSWEPLKKYVDQLKTTHIAISTESEVVLGTDFYFDGGRYFLSLIKNEQSNTLGVNSFVKAYQIKIQNPYNAEKLVASRVFETQQISKVELVGILVSPFEKRGAILVLEKQTSAGGGANGELHVFGAHLKVGFK